MTPPSSSAGSHSFSKLAAFDAAAARSAWPAFVGIDEGLDRMFRWEPSDDAVRWSTPLAAKCRTLQSLSPDRIFGVHDRGYFEGEFASGSMMRPVDLEAGGVVAASRLENSHTFLAGLNFDGQQGVTFSEFDRHDRRVRGACFSGDYVRGATLTTADTILFTNNDRVLEGDWSGRILREFVTPGFKHAWKALRLENDHTLISGGYGAFVVEFDPAAREVRRWACGSELAGRVRPNFFGDFTRLSDGSLVVCNWLGHGTGLGGTGCALVMFNPQGEVVKLWQDAKRTSSVQAFVLFP